MRTDGCGGHGINPDGLNPRDESCESCRRWSWFPMPMAYRNLVSDAYCEARYCRQSGNHDDDGAYDAAKADWRQSGRIFDALTDAGLWIVPAPPCKCGAAIGERIHMDITVSEMRDGVHFSGPESKDQHPYEAAS